MPRCFCQIYTHNNLTLSLTLAIFDVFSQIQYNGGMPRQVQACLKLNRRTGLIPVIFLRF